MCFKKKKAEKRKKVLTDSNLQLALTDFIGLCAVLMVVASLANIWGAVKTFQDIEAIVKTIAGGSTNLRWWIIVISKILSSCASLWIIFDCLSAGANFSLIRSFSDTRPQPSAFRLLMWSFLASDFGPVPALQAVLLFSALVILAVSILAEWCLNLHHPWLDAKKSNPKGRCWRIFLTSINSIAIIVITVLLVSKTTTTADFRTLTRMSLFSASALFMVPVCLRSFCCCMCAKEEPRENDQDQDANWDAEHDRDYFIHLPDFKLDLAILFLPMVALHRILVVCIDGSTTENTGIVELRKNTLLIAGACVVGTNLLVILPQWIVKFVYTICHINIIAACCEIFNVIRKMWRYISNSANSASRFPHFFALLIVISGGVFSLFATQSDVILLEANWNCTEIEDLQNISVKFGDWMREFSQQKVNISTEEMFESKHKFSPEQFAKLNLTDLSPEAIAALRGEGNLTAEVPIGDPDKLEKFLANGVGGISKALFSCAASGAMLTTSLTLSVFPAFASLPATVGFRGMKFLRTINKFLKALSRFKKPLIALKAARKMSITLGALFPITVALSPLNLYVCVVVPLLVALVMILLAAWPRKHTRRLYNMLIVSLLCVLIASCAFLLVVLVITYIVLDFNIVVVRVTDYSGLLNLWIAHGLCILGLIMHLLLSVSWNTEPPKKPNIKLEKRELKHRQKVEIKIEKRELKHEKPKQNAKALKQKENDAKKNGANADKTPGDQKKSQSCRVSEENATETERRGRRVQTAGRKSSAKGRRGKANILGGEKTGSKAQSNSFASGNAAEFGTESAGRPTLSLPAGHGLRDCVRWSDCVLLDSRAQDRLVGSWRPIRRKHDGSWHDRPGCGSSKSVHLRNGRVERNLLDSRIQFQFDIRFFLLR
eukprot:279602_1